MDKKEKILKTLITLAENNIWSEAKYYATIIYNSDEINEELLIELENIIGKSIVNCNNEIYSKKLISAQKTITEIKQKELNERSEEKNEGEKIINNYIN